MRWAEWLFRKSFRSVSRPASRRQEPCRLKVEHLEDRVVPATVTGTIFTDFNYNGTQQLNPTVANDSGQGSVGLANEAGVAGVTVTITDTLGATNTTTTGANGTYSLTLTGTGPYRVVVNTPTGFVPGPVSGNNQGAVRFVPEGASTVDLGIVRPDQYTQANPQIAVANYVFGDQLTGANAGSTVVSSFAYSAGSNSTTSAAGYDVGVRTTLATASQVGSVWGLAYNPNTQTVFASAFYRRHSGFGPSGPGAIYAINRTTGAVTTLINIPSAGTDPHNTANYSTDNTRTVVNGINVDSGWDSVGKVGWGGMAISDDGSTLYAVNLGDRRLYIIPIANPAAATSVAIPLPTTNGRPNTDARPFAVSFYQGRIYVGVTDTAESTITAPNPAGDPTQLQAYVFSFDAANIANGAVQNLAIPLNYNRGQATGSNGGTTANWQPWSRGYTQLNAQGNGTFETAIYAMPWLTGIAFDASGNMTLGLRDRLGDTTGAGAQSDPSRPGVAINGIAVGDVLRTFGNPTTGWTLESNGRGPGGTPVGSGVGNNQGPGGGEFYNDDVPAPTPAVGTTAAGNTADQAAMGAVLALPGHPDVISTFVDPVEVSNDLYEGGLRWLSQSNGSFTKGYRLYIGRFNNTPASFGKANGLGDIVALSNAPPTTTIGDHIFIDKNNDGQQDPGDPGISGLTINLIRNGAIVNTTTTNGNGNYLFTQEADGSALRPNTAYQISTSLGQAALSGTFIATANATGVPTNLNSKFVSDGMGNAVINFTTGNVGQNNFDLDGGFIQAAAVGHIVFNDPTGSGLQTVGETGVAGVRVTLFDSNGVAIGNPVTTGANGLYSFTNLRPGTYSIGFDPTSLPAGTAFSPPLQGNNPALDSNADPTTGRTAQFTLAAGQNNTTIDAGVTSTLASVGDTVFRDLNDSGIQAAGDPGVPGVTVRLFNSAGQQVGNPLVTDANGKYLFTAVAPGTYTIGFDPATLPVGTVFSPALRGNDRSLDSNADPVTGQTAPFTLAARQTDLTIDAGVVGVGSVSGSVYVDTNNDGIRQSTETGVPNTTVTLTGTTDIGTTVSKTTTTDGLGNYVFPTLRPGTYTVSETQPAGYTAGKVTAGTTGGTAGVNVITGIPVGTGVASLANNFGELLPTQPTVDVAIVQTVSNSTPRIGDTVTLTFVVNNNGPGTATNVVASTPLPNGLQFVSVQGIGQGTFDPSTLNYYIGTLQPGQATTLAIAVKVLQAGPFTNIATVSTSNTETTLANNRSPITITTPNDPATVSKQNFLTTTTTTGTLPLVAPATAAAANDSAVIVTGTQPGVPALVQVFDRKSGATKFAFYAFDPSFTGGVNVAEGDVNGDGTPDIVVAPITGGGPRVRVFDGTTGLEIRSFFAYDPGYVGGVNIAVADVEGTGKQDIIVGTTSGHTPHVKVFSGATGAEVYSFFAYATNYTGGVNVAGGDIDGDKRADIITGSAFGASHVKVFSGASGQEIRSFYAYAPVFLGGVTVAAGDIDGDGKADIITGAGAGGGPHVKAFSGVNLTELRSFYADASTFTGGVRVAATDVNGDGIADIVTAPASGEVSNVRTYSGKDLTLLDSFLANDSSYAGGVTLAAK